MDKTACFPFDKNIHVQFLGNGGDSGIGTHMGVDVGDSRSVVAAASHWDTMSDKDSVSLQAHSVAASQVEKTLSEVASSFSVGLPRHGPHDSAYAQIRLAPSHNW